MRRSMGIRGPDSYHGFFTRMRERANGRRCGLLERLIESIRGNAFTTDKCRRITLAYDRAMERLDRATTESQKIAVLEELDREVKAISYG